MKNKKLAIIIPTYKARFLRDSLLSIAKQSCQDFNVYIGDDCSPENIKSIVDDYEELLPITYCRFSENEGGTNLVNHWNRCLKMTKGEEFFWLFSDDDIMGDKCVELFYKTISKDVDEDVLHFNIDIIDSEGKVISKTPDYPEMLSSEQFFSLLFTNKINARVPEFIFRSKSIMGNGGFVNFDLAWRSDNATVIQNGLSKGIRTIVGAKVLWRASDINISSGNMLLAERKDHATIDFFNWVNKLFKRHGIKYSLSIVQLVIAYRKKMGLSCATFNPKSLYMIAKEFELLDSFVKKLLFVLLSYYVRIENLTKRMYEN